MADEVPGSPGAVPTTPPPRRPTVMQEFSFVCFATAAASVLMLLEGGTEPNAVAQGARTPFSCAASFLGAFAHAMWISLDRRRHGLEAGWWRFGAFFLGPLVVWLYLIVRYRLRALWMIPVSLIPYVVCSVAAVLAYELAWRSLQGK